MSTTITTIESVNEEEGEPQLPPLFSAAGEQSASGFPLGPLSDAQAAEGVAFVDNSGSTGGELLKTLKKFTLELGPRKCALWNSSCGPLIETPEIEWSSMGCTMPSDIFAPNKYGSVPAEWRTFTLLTDGEVNRPEYEKLGGHAHKTSHLPTILGIAINHSNSTGLAATIARCNVSVLSSHYTAARNALFVVFSSTTDHSATGSVHNEIPRVLTVRVLAAKGQWETAFGAIPDLSTAVMLNEFPTCTMAEIRSLRAEIFERQPDNTVLVNDGAQWLYTDRLLQVANPAEVVERINEADMEAIVRSYHSNGRLPELRRWLNDMTATYALEAEQAVRSAAAAATAGGGGSGVGGGSGMRQILARMRHARNDAEREELRSALFGSAERKAVTADVAAVAVKAELKLGRKLIGVGLQIAAALEQAGMGADMLGRLSNRAKRSKKIHRDQLVPISNLDATGAPEAECNVMLDKGPVVLLVRRVDDDLAEENTSDFSIDFALSVGCTERNNVWCPDVIGIADGVADRIEEQQQSVLTRDDTVVAIPMISLSDSAGTNKEQLFKRLCLAFMGGLGLPSVWLVTLSAIEHALTTKAWAAPGTEVGNVLTYFGGQIMEHVILPKGHKLALEEAMPVRAALAKCIAEDVFVQHYPLDGTVTAASALIRHGGGPTAAPVSHYIKCVQARAARAVPQQHLAWLKRDRLAWSVHEACGTHPLWRSIYAVRTTAEGAIVPVAGSHMLPSSWEGVLNPYSCAALDKFAHVVATVGGGGGANASSAPSASVLDGRGDSLITPGLAAVVRGTLALGSKHVSSTAAVQNMRRFHPVAAAECDPETIGKATEDEALAVLVEWLVWARCPLAPLPPFATKFGPSVLFFYHNRTVNGGGVTDMTAGFQWSINGVGEVETENHRFERLADHIRAVRGALLHAEFAYNLDGSFAQKTRSTPLHKQMVNAWGKDGVDPEDDTFIGAVLERLLSAKTGNVHYEFLEHEIAMLVPSLKRVGQLGGPEAVAAAAMAPGAAAPTDHTDDDDGRVSLATRIATELAGRTTDEVAAESDAAPAIWVPRTDRELQQRIARGAVAVELASKAVIEKAAADAAAAAAAAAGADAQAMPATIKKVLFGNRLGRTMTAVLRHNAEAMGLAVASDGYVALDALLALPKFSGVTVHDVKQIVEADGKQRFSLLAAAGNAESGGSGGVVGGGGGSAAGAGDAEDAPASSYRIRANQGHSMSVVDARQLLVPITDPTEVPICIHGTYLAAWELIKAQHLDRMGRNEIHMASGMPGDKAVKSGIRSGVEVLIYVDVGKAMEQGIPFFRSVNGVIMTPGPIPVSCFAHAARRSDGAALLAPRFARTGSEEEE